MKKMRILCCAALVSVFALSMSGCQIIDKFTGNTETEEESTAESASAEVDVKVPDQTVKAPTFSSEASGLLPTIQGSEVVLDATAVSSDGGQITYQWYVNNIDSNSGGTRIEGATSAQYKPDTSEVDVKFYYAVASNEIDKRYNTATSGVFKVETLQKGEFTEDEFGGIRYLSDDGTYISDREVTIDGNDYYFDTTGYRFAGWRYTDAYYFYQDDGVKVKDCDFNGYHFDKDGKLDDGQDPLGLFTSEDAAAEETTTEEAPAEETTTEEAPAEETTTEEAPAEEAATEEAAVDETTVEET